MSGLEATTSIAALDEAQPYVDLVIAVHTERRAIERAAGSALSDPQTPVRVTVVCHGVDPLLIEQRLGALMHDSRLRLLHFVDGVPSPSGPFNHGLDAATGRFTAVLGSDDELEPGAIDSWIALQQKDDAEVVIPRLRMASGASLRTPPTRPGRRRDLDGSRDRLAYRTAQLGLVSRERFGHLRFSTTLRSGEDIAYGLRLWFSGARISYDRRGPGYVIHDDASDRSTITRKDVAEDFAFLDDAVDPSWIASLARADREAIVVKLLRTHVMDALRARFLDGLTPSDGERDALASEVRRILAVAPQCEHIVSILDRRLLRALRDPGSDPREIERLLRRRAVLLSPTNLLSATPRYLLHREAPLRFFAAIAVTR